MAIRSLRKDIRSIFTPPPEAKAAEVEAKFERIMNHPVLRYGSFAFRYGMLVFILWLLAWEIWIDLKFRASYGDPYGSYVLTLTLLFNHLAFFFKWSKRITVTLWILAWSWLAFSLFYVFYLSNVLDPSKPLPIP